MELSGLKNELRHLLVIAQQLEPYIRSISSLMERIQPQVGASQEEEEEDHGARTSSMTPAPVSTKERRERELSPPTKLGEEERIMAILERIQSIKQSEYRRQGI